MNKKFILTLSILLVVCLGIGGKVFMDNREKDKEELRTIQTDLATYIYNNFTLFTDDPSKVAEIDKEYNEGNGNLSDIEYLKKLKTAQIYSDIKKIEFTKFSTTPMNTVEVHFIINNVYKDQESLDTVSAETNKLIYHIGEFNGSGPYYLEKKKESTNKPIPKNYIIYYEGGIN